MKCLVFLAAVAAVALAQTKTCVNKNAFVSNVTLTSNDDAGPRRGMYHGDITFYYDFTNMRVRHSDVFERVPDFNNPHREDTFDFYKEKMRYRYNVTSKMCTKEALTTPFRPIETNSDAKFVSQQWIGVEGALGAGMQVDIFRAASAEGVAIQMFSESCIPVMDYTFGKTVWTHYNFYDVIVPKEVPASWFELPESCK